MKQVIFLTVLLSTTLQTFSKEKISIENVDSTEFKNVETKYDFFSIVDTTTHGIKITKSGTIILPLRNSNNKKIISQFTSSEDFIKKIYKYIGFIKSIDCYLLSLETFESEYKILVKRNDGKIYRSKRFIVPSYNKIVVSYDMPENDRYTGVTLINVTKNSFDIVGEVKEKSWFPLSIVLNANNEIFIKAQSFDTNDVRYLKATIIGD